MQSFLYKKVGWLPVQDMVLLLMVDCCLEAEHRVAVQKMVDIQVLGEWKENSYLELWYLEGHN